MGTFSVDLDQLDQTVARLRRFERFLDDRLGEVDRRVRSVQAGWHGPAAQAQRAAQQDWVAAGGEMRAAMSAVGDAAATAHANYCAAVQANHRGWHW